MRVLLGGCLWVWKIETRECGIFGGRTEDEVTGLMVLSARCGFLFGEVEVSRGARVVLRSGNSVVSLFCYCSPVKLSFH